ncbi:complex I subunit 5 family protein [Ornithinimicrobium sediminis]|uniref:complex I subunit 5 family protein n=1 Tax=Ornithinimicrobium sediminis TaxID=2904603 RepID=UPI001E2FA0AE|nr:proton-conducting transporter membrane subunit [Ornithinimicrobium sediminis]MCE0487992.1 hypothetical protein [Ornithinimicrobium sediminis]
MSDLLAALVLVPLGAAVVTALLPARAAGRVGLVVALALGAGSVLLALEVGSSGVLEAALGDWSIPLGIGLRADGLSALMVLLTGVVGAFVSVYASGSAAARGGALFWPVWLVLWAGLNAVYLAADLFNTYVALELVGLGAVGLVALGGPAALAAALRYLFVAVLGSLAYLLGVGLVYAETATLDIATAGQRLEGGVVMVTALSLMTVGMALKTALFPLHAWLPPAHSGAPAAVSPLLSALVVKASFYVVVRLWFGLPGADGAMAVATLVGVLGAVGVVWAAVVALRQTHLKRMVAYSTVAQVGYLFLLLPLAVPGLAAPAGAAEADAARLAWSGVAALVVAHGLAKSAMFMSAGTLARAHGSDRLDDLHGAVTRMPAVAMTFALSGVCLAGLPPTLAFVGKWQLVQAALAAGQWWWVPVLLVGGLLTFAYTAAGLRAMFDEPQRADELVELRPVARRMVVAPLVLAVLAVALGLRSVELLALVEVGSVLGSLP